MRAALLLCLVGVGLVGGSDPEVVPQCPESCGDNPSLFCPTNQVIHAEEYAFSQIVGLVGDDGWDIRVYQHDVSDPGVPARFQVQIMTTQNFNKFANGDLDYQVCQHKHQKLLNKETTCVSMQGKFCRQVEKGPEKGANYTHVVIHCRNNNVNCPLLWNVRGLYFPHKGCRKLGMSCGLANAIIIIFFLGSLGALAFAGREHLAAAYQDLPDWSTVQRKLFKGRFDGVEEMEARLAARSLDTGAGDMMGGEGTKEPYSRL